MSSRSGVMPMSIGVNDPLRLLLAIAQQEGVGETARTASLGGAVGAGIVTVLAPDEPGLIALGALVGVLATLNNMNDNENYDA